MTAGAGKGSGGTGGGDDDRDGDGFADLLGEGTRRLDPGKARVAPARGRPRGGKRDADTTAKPGFRWPDSKERGCAAAPGVSDAQLFALKRGDPEPEERIDLHGTRRDAAKTLLARRLESARAQGLRCVVVIHGRGQHSATGEAVLRDKLPGWLSTGANAGHVLAFAPAPNRLGGAGATLVLLARPR